MMVLSEQLGKLTSAIDAGIEGIKSEIMEHPITSVGIASGAGVISGGIAGTLVTSRSSSNRKRRKKSYKKTSRGRKRDRMFKSKQKHEQRYKRKKKYKVYGKKGYQYPKRRKSSSKKRVGKIYKTKNGQPYKILASGKAKFIKRRK